MKVSAWQMALQELFCAIHVGIVVQALGPSSAYGVMVDIPIMQPSTVLLLTLNQLVCSGGVTDDVT